MKILAIGLMLLAVGTLSACTTTRAERTALIGASGGAVIGGLAARSVGGAVVGGAVGGLAGYAFGKHTHPCWKTVFGHRYRGSCWN